MDNNRFGSAMQMGGIMQNGININNMNNSMPMNQFGNIGGMQNHIIGNIGNNAA